MPYYEMRDAFGTMYRITTQSTELAQAWFDEWLPRLYPPEMPADYGLPVMTVWPMWTADNLPDWAAFVPFISESFTIPRDPKMALAAIAERRALIDEKARQAHADGK